MKPSADPEGGSGVRWDGAVVAALLVYFAARLCYFAVNISPIVPPDEITHVQRCLAYSAVPFIPRNTPKTDFYGLVTNVPYLYYFLMGKLMHLNAFPMSDLVFLRLMNAILGLATVIFAYRWVRLLTENRVARVFFVALLTNTPMFTLVCASVNYDNLTNLLAAMSFFYLFAFFERRESAALAALVACLLAGFLTKRAFLPLGCVVILILAVREWRSFFALLRARIAWPGSLRPGHFALGALIALLFVANLELYGGNLLRYGQLIPAPDRVVGLQRAMKNNIFARNYITKKYRDGEVSFERAMELTELIWRPGDRGDAQWMLKVARHHAATGEPRMGRGEYLLVWTHTVVSQIFGIAGHLGMPKSTVAMLPYYAMLGLAMLAVVVKLRLRDHEGYPACAAGAVLFYVLVLMWLVNYPAYLETGVVEIGLQGRYVFPVLVPMWGIVSHYLIGCLPCRAQAMTAALIGGYLVYGDWPYFLAHATQPWFRAVG